MPVFRARYEKCIQLVLGNMLRRRRVRVRGSQRRIARRMRISHLRWCLFISLNPAKKTPDHGYIGRNHTKSCIEESRSKTTYRPPSVVTNRSTAHTAGLTLNIPDIGSNNWVIRCTTNDPDGCLPPAEQEFPGVDYCANLHQLLREEPDRGIDMTHDIVRALLPYRGIHMEVEPRVLDGDVDVLR